MKYSRPAISMVTDMSSHPDHQVAGWGGWISVKKQIMTGSGSLPWSINSEELEVFAMNRMLKQALAKGFIGDGNVSIRIQADNVAALRILAMLSNVQALEPEHIMDNRILPLKTIPKWTKGATKNCIVEFITLSARFDRVYVQHVRGHSPKNVSKRHRINNECDRLAKKAMQAQLPGRKLNIHCGFQQNDRNTLQEYIDTGP